MPSLSRPGLWTGTVTCAALAALWLLAHPYLGIAHDARLYAVQALSRRYPGFFTGDLFLMQGAQEEFTLFSRLWAPLIGTVSIGSLALGLVVVAHGIWLWGAVRLLRQLAGGRSERLLALAGVFVLPAAYGAFDVFSYGEGFLTPRILAEALVLHAFAFSLRGRVRLALAGIFVSALLQPLIAIPAAVIVGIRLCWNNRRWLWAGAALAAAVVALTVLRVEPFGRLLITLDPEWLAIAQQRCPFTFPSLWGLGDWYRVALQFVLLTAAAALGKAARPFLLAVLAAGSAMLAISLVVSAFYLNALIIQLQIWRVLWVVAILANASTGYLTAFLWRESRNRTVLICLMANSWLWIRFPEVALPMLLLFSGLLAFDRKNPKCALHPAISIAVFAITGITVATGVALVIGQLRNRSIHAMSGVLGRADFGLIVFPVGLAIFLFWRSNHKWKMPVLAVAAGMVFMVSLVTWDRRSPWRQWVESSAPQAAPFSAVLAKNAQVFWVEGFAETWLVLRHPSYFSYEQGAGVLFTRANAFEFRRRFRSLLPLSRNLFRFLPMTEGFTRPPDVTLAALGTVCENASGLDAIISSTKVPGVSAIVWRPPVVRTVTRWTDHGWVEESEPELYLYPCSAVRSVVPFTSRGNR